MDVVAGGPVDWLTRALAIETGNNRRDARSSQQWRRRDKCSAYSAIKRLRNRRPLPIGNLPRCHSPRMGDFVTCRAHPISNRPRRWLRGRGVSARWLRNGRRLHFHLHVERAGGLHVGLLQSCTVGAKTGVGCTSPPRLFFCPWSRFDLGWPSRGTRPQSKRVSESHFDSSDASRPEAVRQLVPPGVIIADSDH